MTAPEVLRRLPLSINNGQRLSVVCSITSRLTVLYSVLGEVDGESHAKVSTAFNLAV